MNERLSDAYALCGATVRRDDGDRWSASLFWPEAVRPHVHALVAFDLEVARVRGAVSGPLPGEIRCRWWTDAITERRGAGNPIAEALLDTIVRHDLDADRLLALVDARRFDLYDDPMASRSALESYVRDTSGTMFQAIARLLAPGCEASPAVEAAGLAFGLTELLRGLPWQVMRGQLFLPADVLATFQLPPTEVLAHRNSPALGLVLNASRARVRVHLAAMRDGLEAAGAAAPACLPAFLCEPYLKAMERPALNPFETPIEIARWRRLAILWRAARRL